MSHNVKRRLRKLEGQRHGRPRPILVFGMSRADAERQLAAKEASGEIRPEDEVHVIHWRSGSDEAEVPETHS